MAGKIRIKAVEIKELDEDSRGQGVKDLGGRNL